MPPRRKVTGGGPPPTPYWQSKCGRAVVYVGDCLDVVSCLGLATFHAVVTDPPYGLEFMGEEWDAPWKNEAGFNDSQSEDTTGRGSWIFGGTPSSKVGRPCYGNKRKPPGFDKRTKEDRDRTAREAGHKSAGAYGNLMDRGPSKMNCDSHVYQEWFMQRSRALLIAARPGAHLLSFGGTRMWHRMACAIEDAGWEVRDTMMWVYGSGFPKSADVSKGIDKLAGAEEAKEWAGWGTALKPSYEPIILARKPPIGSVAKNTLEHGCGGLNIDGCRVGDEGGTKAIEGSSPDYLNKVYGNGMGGCPSDVNFVGGRWPANFIHDGSEEVMHLLPNGAARFFYSAKADSGDRPHGRGRKEDGATAHPTVKPLDLMRYLVRLVCPMGGVLLDPFMGSGSTGCAALLEGMRFVGVEQSTEYADIAVGRLKLVLGEDGRPS